MGGCDLGFNRQFFGTVLNQSERLFAAVGVGVYGFQRGVHVEQRLLELTKSLRVRSQCHLHMSRGYVLFFGEERLNAGLDCDQLLSEFFSGECQVRRL